MKLTLAAIVIAVVAGALAGGRLSCVASAKIRWPLLAPLGLALQMIPAPGRRLPLALLFVSFGLLLVFTAVNFRLPGFALILLGLALNLSVIAWNGGMPVTHQALVASHQQNTLSLLIHDGGAKHHLATSGDALLPLADVIPFGWGINQVVSVGDLASYLGIMWLIVSSMRRRRGPALEGSSEQPSSRSVAAHVGT